MPETAAAPESILAGVKRRLSAPRTLAVMAVMAVVAGAGAAGYWKLALKPERELAEKRFRAHSSLMRLYDLQVAYRGAHAAYANDLDSLLAGSPDATTLRATLKGCVDLNTLAIVGNADRFRLEANVLDPDRTLIKFKGSAPGR